MATKKSSTSSPATDEIFDIKNFLDVYKVSPTILDRYRDEGKVGYQLTVDELTLLLKNDKDYIQEEAVQKMLALCEAFIAGGLGALVILRVIPFKSDENFVSLYTFSVQKYEDVVGIYDADRNLVDDFEVEESTVGIYSRAICKYSGIRFAISIRLSKEILEDAYTAAAQQGRDKFTPHTFSGIPPEEVSSFLVDNDLVETYAAAAIGFLRPTKAPLNTPIQIIGLLEPDEKFGTPKILVSVDGAKPVEMLVSAPIRKAVTGNGREINESDIDKKFEILSVVEYRPGGRPVPVSAEDSRPQMTVLCRRIYEAA